MEGPGSWPYKCRGELREGGPFPGVKKLNKKRGLAEMAQWVKALATQSDDLGPISSTYHYTWGDRTRNKLSFDLHMPTVALKTTHMLIPQSKCN